MIKINVQLENNCYNILKLFGPIDTVVDKALKLVENGSINIEECPAIPTSRNSKHLLVTINNEYYEQLRAIYGPTSPKVSINRLLYYIVDNEIYNAYNWERVDYDNTTRDRIERLKYDINTKLKTLRNLCIKPGDKAKIDEALKLINDL